MDQVEISTQTRRIINKGENRRLRRSGAVPAVIYGRNRDLRIITVDRRQLELILRGAHHSNAVFIVTVDKEAAEQTLIREIQRHPLNEALLHVDFLRVDVEQTVEMNVPVHLVGEAPAGVKAGGVLERIARTVKVRCKPLDMPHALDLDASRLEIGHSLHVRDLVVPEGLVMLDSPDEVLVSILAPTVAAEPLPGEGAEVDSAEPELVGGKKEEGAGE